MPGAAGGPARRSEFVRGCCPCLVEMAPRLVQGWTLLEGGVPTLAERPVTRTGALQPPGAKRKELISKKSTPSLALDKHEVQGNGEERGKEANFSPVMAKSREAKVQGQNAKPLRNAGVIGSAERGCHCRIGAPGGIRTPDQRLRKPLLYPAELQARDAYCPRLWRAARVVRTKAGT